MGVFHRNGEPNYDNTSSGYSDMSASIICNDELISIEKEHAKQATTSNTKSEIGVDHERNSKRKLASQQCCKVFGCFMGVLTSFRDFISRGSIIDLAVGLVIGAAITAVVTSFVEDIISPFIGLALNGISMENMFVVVKYGNDTTTTPEYFTVDQAKKAGAVTWNYGRFMQTVVAFFITGFCLFLLVKSVEKMKELAIKNEEGESKQCFYCYETIHIDAIRCGKCTSYLVQNHHQIVTLPEAILRV